MRRIEASDGELRPMARTQGGRIERSNSWRQRFPKHVLIVDPKLGFPKPVGNLHGGRQDLKELNETGGREAGIPSFRSAHGGKYGTISFGITLGGV